MQIERRVEGGGRIAPLLPAALVIVLERIDAGRGDVLVDREITRGVEEGVRIAPLVPAEGVEVRQRIDAREVHVGIAAVVVERVE